MDGQQGTVIDPYAGSGTTLVAAKLLGCDYLGIEIAEHYVKMAEERLENCERERSKLQAELEKHKVEKTFKQRKEEGLWVGNFRKTKGALGELLVSGSNISLQFGYLGCRKLKSTGCRF